MKQALLTILRFHIFRMFALRLFLFLLSGVAGPADAAAQRCAEYSLILKKLEASFRHGNGNLRTCLDLVDALRACAPAEEQVANDWNRRIFSAIERQKASADENARIAREALATVEKERQKALRDTRVAEVTARALDAERSGNKTLALQLAHEACKMANDSNFLALKARHDLLSDPENQFYSQAIFGVGVVTAMAYSPNGDYLLIGNGDGEVYILNRDVVRLRTRITSGGMAVKKASLSPNMDFLGIIDRAGNIYICKLVGQDKSSGLFQITAPEILPRAPYETWGENIITYWDGYPIPATFCPEKDMILKAISESAAGLLSLGGDTLAVFSNHKDRITDLAFSPDRTLVLTASADNTVKLWDMEGQEIRTFAGHTKGVNAVVFSPDGQMILTGSDDNTAKLWDVDGNLIQTFYRHLGAVIAVAFSPDGTSILTASRDRTAKRWDLQGNLLQSFEGHSEAVNTVAFSPDGKSVLTGSADRSVKRWEVKDNAFFDGIGDITSIAFSPDGKHLLACSDNDGTAKLWDIDGQFVRCFGLSNSLADAGAFSSDGKQVLLTDGYTFQRWTVDGKLLQASTGPLDVFEFPYIPGKARFAYSNDGHFVRIRHFEDRLILLDDSVRISNPVYPEKYVGLDLIQWDRELNLVGLGFINDTARICFWDIRGNLLRSMPLPVGAEEISTLAFSPDGQFLLTGDEDGMVKRWDINGHLLQAYDEFRSDVAYVRFSPDAQKVWAVAEDGTAGLWDLGGDLLHTFSGVGFASFSPNGNTLITYGGEGSETPKLWSFDGKLLQTYSGHDDIITDMAFSPGGSTLATCGNDGAAMLWDIHGKLLQTFMGHTDEVNALAFSPDGKTLATVSSDQTIKLWDMDGDNTRTFSTGKEGAELDISFSPDGQGLLTGGSDSTAKLWNLDGSLWQVFSGHEDGINAVAFSPDGNRILTGSDDATARLWDLAGNALQTFSGHKDEIFSVAFAPDGKSMVTGSEDGTVVHWNLKGEVLQTFSCEDTNRVNGVSKVAFSPDGKYILSLDSDNKAKLWITQQASEKQPALTWELPGEVNPAADYSPSSEWLVVSVDGHFLPLQNPLALLDKGERVQSLSPDQKLDFGLLSSRESCLASQDYWELLACAEYICRFARPDNSNDLETALLLAQKAHSMAPGEVSAKLIKELESALGLLLRPR